MSVNGHVPSHLITRPRWHIIIPAVTIVACVFGGLTVVVSKLDAHSLGDILTQIALAIALFVGGLYIVGSILSDAFTRFTEIYVQRPTLSGARRHSWSDLSAIRSRGNLVDFVFASGGFRLNLYLFSNPRDIVAYVRAHVAESQIDAPY